MKKHKQQHALRSDALATTTTPLQQPREEDAPLQANPALQLSLGPLSGALRADPIADESDAQVEELLHETDELLRSLESGGDAVRPGVWGNSSAVVTASGGSSSSSSPVYAASRLPRPVEVPMWTTAPKAAGGSLSKPGRTRNVTRDRMKAELAALRGQAVALKHELQTIQHNQLSKMLVIAATRAALPGWEKVAKRQKRGRELAEAENARLRRALETQTKHVVSLEEALYTLRRLVHEQPQHMTRIVTPRSPKAVYIEPGDGMLFEMLLSELDSTYLRLGEVFRAAEIDNLDRTQSYSRVTPRVEVQDVNKSLLRSFVEMVDVELSPFDFDLRTRVSWLCSKSIGATPSSVEYAKTVGRDDVVARKIRAKRVMNGSEVFFDLLCAMKRVVLSDSVVCVWHAVFNGGEFFPNAYVQETGWSVSTSLKTSPGSSSATVETSCIQLEPKRFVYDASPEDSAGAHLYLPAEADVMTNLVVDAYDADMEEINEMMESMLMAEVSRRITVA